MQELVDVKIKRIEDGIIPKYQREGDTCLDCYARIGASSIDIPARSRCLVNLGFALELPDGWEAIIRPRSGMTKIGIDDGIGTIDTNYRGEVKACIINNTDDEYRINKGDRICQIAIRRAPKVNLIEVDELSQTNRGEDGFGSSGV